jgi:superkiller protein 3
MFAYAISLILRSFLLLAHQSLLTTIHHFMKKLSPQTQKHLSDLFQQGQRAMQNGQFGRAEKCLMDILKIAPHAIEANNSLGFVYAASQQHDKALAQFKLVLAANPNHAHTHHNVANSLYSLGAYEASITYFQSALAIDPTLTGSLIHCGMAYHQLGQTDTAIACLHRALDQEKTNAYAFHTLGKFHADLKDYARALDYLQNASNLAPNNIAFKLEFAKALDKAGLLDEAALLYHKICEENPNYLAAFHAYAELLREYRRFDEALECANRAEQISPNDIETDELVANIYLGMGNTEEALKRFNKALGAVPDKLSILKGIGVAYLEVGNLNDATATAEKMISINSEAPDGYLLKSRVKKSTTDDGQAEHYSDFVRHRKYQKITKC